ncbi:MAG TPA: NTP transferase domain-containing protein [Allosphingosinicella sp.]|nr:NTP transferase domain-containing protein [Allosphingosinicella sp.]
MKCLIIAAGFGSRLRSRSSCKPLTPVGGRPLIEHVARAAVAAGASELVVATGHEADRLEAFLAALGGQLEAPLRCVRTSDWSRPNGFTVVTGAERIEGDYLLLMADHLFDPRIARNLIQLGSGGYGVRLAVDRNVADPSLDLDDATKVAVGDDGRIVAIGKGLTAYDAIDTGIFLATPALREALIESVRRGGGGSLSEGVQLLADRGRAGTMEIGGADWLDVDDPASLMLAEQRLARFAI